jgi:hypothetical protein
MIAAAAVASAADAERSALSSSSSSSSTTHLKASGLRKLSNARKKRGRGASSVSFDTLNCESIASLKSMVQEMHECALHQVK